MSNEKPLSELGEAAVWYCENGFGIIPLGSWGESRKHPITEHGYMDWFNNPDDARKLWGERPNQNVGIVCGSASGGLIILDIDIDGEKEEDGYKTLSEWEHKHGDLPETAVAITGRGGMHYLYRTDRTDIHPSVNRDLGIDVRAEGSYIVAPPSIHPNGRRYEWQDHPEDTPIAQADKNVYDLIDYVQRNGGMGTEARSQEGPFRLPDVIRDGERNDTLHRYGSSMRARGRSDEEIRIYLEHANEHRCQHPVDKDELERIIKQVCGYERPKDAARLSEQEVGPFGKHAPEVKPAIPFRTDRGKILPNRLGHNLIEVNHARHIDGAPAIWTGQRWEFGKRAISRMALAYADDISMAQKNEVFSYIMDQAPTVSSDNSFDGGYYVQFENCTVNVVTCEVVEPDASMLITATLPIELDMDAPYGFADNFIESISNGDVQTATVMKEIIGACMCCRRVVSQSPMLIGRANTSSSGNASNGKSTYLNTMRAMLGPENVSSLDIATLGQRFQASRIVGKLANLGDDIPDGFLKGEELSTFKKLVTGDSIYTDVKNSDGFEFKPTSTLVFSMNAMPRLADTTDGVFRRLAFVPFRRRFSPSDPDFDPRIIEKLTRKETLQRFALLGLLALPDLIERGQLSSIDDMVEEIEAVRIDNSIVKRWLYDENISDADLNLRPVQDVYEQFMRWCEDSGERFGLSKISFSKELLATVDTIKTSSLMSNTLGKKVRTYTYKRDT